MPLKSTLRLVALVLCIPVLGRSPSALAASGPTAHSAKTKTVALWRIDALGGLSKEIVLSLESLLTKEMSRLAKEIIPSSKTLALQKRYRRLRACQGKNRCLAALGRRLGADYIATGNLASLGKNYVVTLKLIDTSNANTIRRISEPLSGKAEKLIEAVRVAAYRLLAPKLLLGSMQVIVDQTGARIFLDKTFIGKTPHRRVITGLKVGKHLLKISHPDFVDFSRKVKIRFQKTTTIRVNLHRPKAEATPQPKKPRKPIVKDHPVPFYGTWWFWTAVAVGAAAIGATAGWAIGKALASQPPKVINCDNGACVNMGGGP